MGTERAIARLRGRIRQRQVVTYTHTDRKRDRIKHAETAALAGQQKLGCPGLLPGAPGQHTWRWNSCQIFRRTGNSPVLSI